MGCAIPTAPINEITMISYRLVQHPSGSSRVQQFLNGVSSYVNMGKKKYFKPSEARSLEKFIVNLQAINDRKKRLAQTNKFIRVNV